MGRVENKGGGESSKTEDRKRVYTDKTANASEGRGCARRAKNLGGPG